MNTLVSAFNRPESEMVSLFDFHRFLLRVALFLLAAGFPLCLLHLLLPPWPLDQQHMLAAMIDKHAALADSRARILIVGGSSAAFGVDSERISRELSVPVVNLGLHAGLGVEFMLREVAAVATDDDLVILCPEPMLSLDGQYKLKCLAESLYPPSGAYFERDLNLDAAIYIERFRHRLSVFRRSLFLPDTESSPVIDNRRNGDSLSSDTLDALHASWYTRQAFNSFGDHIAHANDASPRPLSFEKVSPYESWNAIFAMNEFANGFGGAVFFYHAPLLENVVAGSDAFSAMYQADLDRKLCVRQLNTFTDSLFPLELFFDSALHLNGEGRQEHTGRLIAALKSEPAAEAAIRRVRATNAVPQKW